jgi:hypothetical protein
MLACTCFARSLPLVDWIKPGMVSPAGGFGATKGLALVPKGWLVAGFCPTGAETTGEGAVATSLSDVQLAVVNAIAPTSPINMS